MNSSAQGKVAVITGSSRGIGKATARAFADAGFRVALTYLADQGGADAVVAKHGADRSMAVRTDIRNEADVKGVIAQVLRTWGRLDVLVNNAGAVVREAGPACSLELWQDALDVNLTGAWLMIREAAPAMRAQGGGSIVNVSSIYGMHGAASLPAYSAAKGGMVVLTRSLAKAWAPDIRVNAVAPGNVITELTTTGGGELLAHFERETPLRRSAKPEEIARAILFLASDDASFITGEVLVVDGGYSIR